MAESTKRPEGEERADVAMSLKEQRQKAFLSTRELAEKADVAPDTIWRIEGGNYKQLRPSTMRRIAQALSVHPSEITEFARKPSNDGQGPGPDTST